MNWYILELKLECVPFWVSDVFSLQRHAPGLRQRTDVESACHRTKCSLFRGQFSLVFKRQYAGLSIPLLTGKQYSPATIDLRDDAEYQLLYFFYCLQTPDPGHDPGHLPPQR